MYCDDIKEEERKNTEKNDIDIDAHSDRNNLWIRVGGITHA